MRFPKKITSLVLAAVMVLSNMGNVYATTDTASKKKKDSYTVTINETDNGVINFEASEETVENFDAGDTVEVKMTPDEGYMIQYFQITSDDTGKVLASVETADDTFSFTMPEKNITVSGGFIEGDYEVVEGDDTTNYISLNLDEGIVEETADISKEAFETLDNSIEPDEVITVSDNNADGLSQTAHTIKLNYTILDADKVTSKTTIDNMWEDSGETVFAVYTKEVPVYIMDDNPDVCVAFINPGIMNNTGSYVDVCFVSDSDTDPVDLTDVISFDEENGIAYIPKSFYFDEEGNETDIVIRSQIAVARDLSDATNDIKVTIENNSSLVKAVSEEEIVKADSYDVTTTFPLLTTDTTSNFDIDKIHIYINDSDVEYGLLSDNWYFDSETGYLTIVQSPVTTYSIKVVIDDSSFTEALKTVISTPANAASEADSAESLLALEGVVLPISVTDKDGKSTTLKSGQVFSYDGKTRYYSSEVLPRSADDSNFSDSSVWTMPNFSSNRYHVVIHQKPTAPSGYTSSTCTSLSTASSGSLYYPAGTEANLISEWQNLMKGTSSLSCSGVSHAYTGDFIDFFMAPPTDVITSDDGSLTVDFGDFSDWIGNRYDFSDDDGALYNYARREGSGTGNYEVYGTSNGTKNYYGRSTLYYSRSNEEKISYLPLACGHYSESQSKNISSLVASDARDKETSHMKIMYVNTEKKYFVAEFYAGYTSGNQVPVGIYKIPYTGRDLPGVTITKKASSETLKRVDKDGSGLKTYKYSKVCKSDMYDLTSGTTFAVWTDSNCSNPATLYKDEHKTNKYSNNQISTKKGSDKTNVFYLDDGNYWVTEIKAPKGYDFVTGKAGKKELTVSGSSVSFTYEDKPLGDPFDLTLTKTGSGNAGLNGAEFTLYYYLNEEDYDNGDSSGTWKFETKTSKDGIAGTLKLDFNYLTSGSLYFVDKNNNDKFDNGTDEVFWPAGIYLLKETTPPEGYLNKGTYSINGSNTSSSFETFELTITETFKSDGNNGWKTTQKVTGANSDGSTTKVSVTDNIIDVKLKEESEQSLVIQKVSTSTTVYKVNKNGVASSTTTTLADICNGSAYDTTSGTTFSIWTSEDGEKDSDKATLYTDSTFSTKKSNNIVSTKKNSDKTDAIYLKPGTYWIKEESAPEGFTKAINRKQVEIESGKSQTFKFVDNPIGKKFDFTIIKTGDDKAKLKNVEFTVEYYKNGVSDSATPKTMVFKTDKDGVMKMDLDHLVSGTLYYKDDGSKSYDSKDTVFFPAGTYVITETSTPTGYFNKGTYKINNSKSSSSFKILEITIKEYFKSDGDGGWVTRQKVTGADSDGGTTTVNVTNDSITIDVEDESVRGGLAIEKLEAGKEYNETTDANDTLNATFGIKNNNDYTVYLDTDGDGDGDTELKPGKVYKVTAEDDGRWYSNPTFLQKGQYIIYEAKAPAHYTKTDTKYTIEITKHGQYYIIANNTKRSDGSSDFEDMKAYVTTAGKYETDKSKGEDTLVSQTIKYIIPLGGSLEFKNKDSFTNEKTGTTPKLYGFSMYKVNKDVLDNNTNSSGTVDEDSVIGQLEGGGGTLRAHFQIINNSTARDDEGTWVDTNGNKKEDAGEYFRLIYLDEDGNGSTETSAYFALGSRWLDVNGNGSVQSDEIFAPGEVMYDFWTNKSGKYKSDKELFEAGTYTIRELTGEDDETGLNNVPKSLLVCDDFTVDISSYYVDGTDEKDTAAGTIYEVGVAYGAKEPPKRGGVAIQKVDEDTDEYNQPQAGYDLTAQFDIKNKSSNTVYLDTNGDGKGDYELAPEGTYRITTGSDGRWYSNPTFLPFGTYYIIEVTPPVGYKNSNFKEKIKISEHGQYHIVCEDNAEYADMQAYVNRTYATQIANNITSEPKTIDETTGAATSYYSMEYIQHDVNVEEPVKRGKLKIQKTDRDLKDLQGDNVTYSSTTPQGDASFYQATFNLYYVGKSGTFVMIDKDGKSSNGYETKVTATTTSALAASGIVYTFTTDKNGKAQTPDDYLPYGSYYLKEVTPSAGYLNSTTRNGVVARTITIDEATETYEYSYTDQNKAIYEPVIRGGYKLKKNVNKQTTVYSPALQSYTAKLAEGDTSLAGFTFSIYNISENYVIINNTRYATNKTKVEKELGKKVSALSYDSDGIAQVNITADDVSGMGLTACYTLTTDANGCASTSSTLLPYGTYLVVETTTGTGFNASSSDVISHVVRIREEGVTVSDEYDTSGNKKQGYYNSTWLGGVKIKKNTSDRMDYKSEGDYPAKKAEGDASLEGAVYEIYNISESYVWVDKNGNDK